MKGRPEGEGLLPELCRRMPWRCWPDPRVTARRPGNLAPHRLSPRMPNQKDSSAAPAPTSSKVKTSKTGVDSQLTGHVPYHGTAESIERLAGEVRSGLEKVVGRPLSEVGPYPFLRRGVECLRGTILDQPDAFSEIGFWGSMVVEPGAHAFTIFLPPTATPAQSAVTLAHEIGHLFLHYPLQQPVQEPAVYSRFGDGIEERQANQFAGALLMPKAEFLKVWKRVRKDPLLAGAHFGVMPLDAEARAASLGL